MLWHLEGTDGETSHFITCDTSLQSVLPALGRIVEHFNDCSLEPFTLQHPATIPSFGRSTQHSGCASCLAQPANAVHNHLDGGTPVGRRWHIHCNAGLVPSLAAQLHWQAGIREHRGVGGGSCLSSL